VPSRVIDVSNPDNFADGFPHDFFNELRTTEPVYWHEGDVFGGPGYWIVSKHEDVQWVSKNPNLFASGFGNQIEDPIPGQLEVARSMITMDPPDQARHRKLVSRGFTPSTIANMETKTRSRVVSILDAVAARGQCDFVLDIAAELPLQVIADLLGVPQTDRHQLFDWSNQMLGAEDPDYKTEASASTNGLVADLDPRIAADIESKIDPAFTARINATIEGDGESAQARSIAAGAQMFQYSLQLAQKRLANPGDDLVSDLLRGEVDGEKLDMVEFASFFILLAIAGNETTRNLISHGLLLLLEHPDQLAALRADPSLLPGAVEEMLRFRPTVMYFRRTAMQDCEIRNVRIKKGEKVTLWYPSANRDADVFDDPNRFDISRHPNEHLAFGHGQHFCLGASLARMEVRVMFEELLTRFDDIALSGEVRLLRSHFIDGIKSIPIRFKADASSMP
jgi:cholest-4-en-3-one 26-monooxygenase